MANPSYNFLDQYRRTRTPGPVAGFQAAYSPDTIPDLYLWLDAGVGVYKDAGVTLAANDETVQQWNDRSAWAHHFGQGTAGSRPTYKTGILNSLPVVRFGGAHKLTISIMQGRSNNTFFFVVIPTTTTPGGIFDSAPSQNWTFRNYNTGKWEWNSNAPQITLGLADTNPVLLEFVCTLETSRSVDYYKNGGLVGNSTNASVAPMLWSSNVCIGAINSTLLYYSGDLAECVQFTRPLLDYERQGVENYLNAKYALW